MSIVYYRYVCMVSPDSC